MKKKDYPESVLKHLELDKLRSKKIGIFANLNEDLDNNEARLKNLLKMAKDAQSCSKNLIYLDQEINEIDELLIKIANEMKEIGTEFNNIENELNKTKKRAKKDGWKLSRIPMPGMENAFYLKWTKKKKRK